MISKSCRLLDKIMRLNQTARARVPIPSERIALYRTGPNARSSAPGRNIRAFHLRFGSYRSVENLPSGSKPWRSAGRRPYSRNHLLRAGADIYLIKHSTLRERSKRLCAASCSGQATPGSQGWRRKYNDPFRTFWPLSCSRPQDCWAGTCPIRLLRTPSKC